MSLPPSLEVGHVLKRGRTFSRCWSRPSGPVSLQSRFALSDISGIHSSVSPTRRVSEGELTNFWRVLQDEKTFAAFQRIYGVW